MAENENPFATVLKRINNLRPEGFRDIEFKSDPLIKMLKAGADVGDALGTVPHPMVQLPGSVIKNNLNLLAAFHEANLDAISVLEASPIGPDETNLGEGLELIEEIALGKDKIG